MFSYMEDLKYSKIVIFLTVLMLLLISFSISTRAAHIVQVRTQWDVVKQNVGGVNPIVTYETNNKYVNLRVINGYTYTTTSNNITSVSDRILGILSRVRYYRTYKTY